MRRTIAIDASELGPRSARRGSVMTAEWPDGIDTFTFNGRRWIKSASTRPTPGYTPR